jgi:hypothetical protein
MKRVLVIRAFQDKNTKVHHPVDSFYESDDVERIEFLQNEGFLAADANDQVFPKHVGGGYYELSNEERVQGKKKATTAEKELEERGE